MNKRKPCVHCDEPFIAKHHAQITCSDECREQRDYAQRFKRAVRKPDTYLQGGTKVAEALVAKWHKDNPDVYDDYAPKNLVFNSDSHPKVAKLCKRISVNNCSEPIRALGYAEVVVIPEAINPSEKLAMAIRMKNRCCYYLVISNLLLGMKERAQGDERGTTVLLRESS